MLACDSVDVAGSEIGRFSDLIGGGARTTPEEEIEKGNFDTVLITRDINQFDRWWAAPSRLRSIPRDGQKG